MSALSSQLPGVSIALEAVQAGMVLAEALRDTGGSILLPAGTALTAAVLVALRRRGVGQCVVRGRTSAPAAATAEQQQLRLAQLFRHQAGDVGAGLLRSCLQQYRCREHG